MTDEKSTTSTTATESSTATDGKVDELTRIVHTHVNPTTSSSPTVSSPTGSTRTYTSPLMGTSARAAKRRIDSDSGPIRIEGTDTYNQQLQHHYQNVRQILDDQQQQQQSLSSDTNIPTESRQSFNAKRDFFEQRFKTPPPTYDAPPRQKIITTITSTVPSTNVQDRTSSSSNESPSVDRVLEQAVELQKLSSNLNSTKQDTKVPFIIERTEQYQVFLDSANHEVRRTPSISRTSIIPVGKTGHATDLDQAQAQVQAERLTDDHQAIQSLTRALQEHNISTINEYKRLPSQTNQTSSVSPSNVLHDRTNLPIKSTYSVIDALLNNPIGSVDDRYNELVKLRSNEILTNLRNPEYVNSLKQPTKTIEKKSKTKSSVSTKPVEQSSITPLVTTQTTTVPVQTAEPITTTSNLNTSTSEQAPLIDPKEKKKQDKEKKKQLKKNKSKQKSKTDDYSVLDAIIGSPVSIRLPDSYLTKYHVSPPLSQSAPLSSEPISTPSNTDVTKTTATTSSSPKTKTKTKKKSSSKEKSIPDSEKNKTLFHLTKIVNDVKSHHSTDLPLSSTAPAIEPKESIVSTKPSESTVKQVTTTTTTTTTTTSKQTDTQQKSEPVTPRIIYRYMDEYGNVLKISSTPPSQLREQPSQIYANRSTEPPYFYGRHIAIDDERRHPLAQYEQRATWQGESKLPTTVTREDFESQDKRVPQLIEQSIPASRTVPVSVDHERSSRPSSSQPHQPQSHQYPNQQNIKLAWLPLSYPSDPYYLPAGVAGYETDSTISERSATYRPLEHGLNDGYYRYSARPIPNDYYNRSPVPGFYPPPPPLLSHGGRGISPDYSSNSVSRNYIEVFRGGDFRQTKPSEIYSLPFNEHMRTSPLISTNNRPSRYDQYQSEQYGTLSNSAPFRPSTLSTQQTYHSSNTLPHTHYQTNIPSSTVHTSTYYTHRNPNSNRTVQNSPDPDYSNNVRQSKSFDYRPLRSKLQREYKITPNLLVDEWDYPHTSETTKCSTTTTVTTTNRSGLSSPDEVFFPTRSVKA